MIIHLRDYNWDCRSRDRACEFAVLRYRRQHTEGDLISESRPEGKHQHEQHDAGPGTVPRTTILIRRADNATAVPVAIKIARTAHSKNSRSMVTFLFPSDLGRIPPGGSFQIYSTSWHRPFH